jgi:hypothetical protein
LLQWLLQPCYKVVFSIWVRHKVSRLYCIAYINYLEFPNLAECDELMQSGHNPAGHL